MLPVIYINFSVLNSTYTTTLLVSRPLYKYMYIMFDFQSSAVPRQLPEDNGKSAIPGKSKVAR